MGVRWLAVLSGLAILVQASLSFPEDEEPEEILQAEPKENEEIKARKRRQSGCKDLLDYCAQWPDGYCQNYSDYMKKNCPRKCGYCSGPTQPPDCKDKNQEHCSGWKQSGFCDPSSQWSSFMRNNCRKTCGFCGGGGGGGGGGGSGGGSCGVSGASSKVKACSFNSDTCDWHNVPFDDQMDFKIRSSASGGPSSGAGGSGNFVVTEQSRGKAQLLIPFELVLANHDSDHGTMCIRFNYFMKGGTLKLYSIKNRKGSEKTVVTTLSGDKGSQWNCEKQTVEVSVHRQLLFEATASGSPIALDEISFTDNC